MTSINSTEHGKEQDNSGLTDGQWMWLYIFMACITILGVSVAVLFG